MGSANLGELFGSGEKKRKILVWEKSEREGKFKFVFISFYSRNVLKKLSSPQLKIFRKIERSSKSYLKSLADIKFKSIDLARIKRRFHRVHLANISEKFPP